MYKYLFLLVLVSSTTNAATTIGKTDIDPAHKNCLELIAFTNGAYDDAPAAFGVQKSDWDSKTSSEVDSLIHDCQQISLRTAARTAAPHTLILPTYTDQQANVASSKAFHIEDANRKLLEHEKQLAEEKKQKAEHEAYQAKVKHSDDLRQAVLKCQASDASLFQQSEYEITNAVQDLADLRKRQQYEAEVVQASGVHNLRRERAIGEEIVDTTHKMQQSFAEYKRLGGKAATPQQVTMTVADPCQPLSDLVSKDQQLK